MLASTVTTYKKPKISEIQKLNRKYSLFFRSHFPNILVLGIELRSWIIRLYASLQIESCNQNPFSLPQEHDRRCPWHPQANVHYNKRTSLQKNNNKKALLWYFSCAFPLYYNQQYFKAIENLDILLVFSFSCLCSGGNTLCSQDRRRPCRDDLFILWMSIECLSLTY